MSDTCVLVRRWHTGKGTPEPTAEHMRRMGHTVHCRRSPAAGPATTAAASAWRTRRGPWRTTCAGTTCATCAWPVTTTAAW